MKDAPGTFEVLIVCTGNTCRSPMAEYALRSVLEAQQPGRTSVGSAGITAANGYPATDYAQEAARLWDLDASGHSSRRLTAELVERADLVFAMSPRHHRAITDLVPEAAERTYLLKNFPDNSPQGEEVEDPIGQPLDRYNECFLEIGEFVGKHLPEIVQRIKEKLSA